MNLVRSAVALCCTLLLAACFPPSTDHPIGGGHGSGDRMLLGVWNATMDEGDKGDNKAIFRFSRRNDGGLAVLITSVKNIDDDRMSATVTTAKLGDNRYMNATIVETGKDASKPEDKQRGTVPLLYRVEGSTVALYMMDEDATKAAITTGKIKGEVQPGSFGDAIITADQRELDAFMEGNGAALFTEKFATLTKAD